MVSKILYLGQKSIGEICFDILLNHPNNNIEVCGVVSNINKSIWWKTNNIYKRSTQKNIFFIANSTRHNKKIFSLIKQNNIDTIISVQHPWILPKEILQLVDYNAFNLHNAKLPNYKGYNCCNHAILNGEKYYTSTIHWMADRVDMGDIAFEKTILIDINETALSLYKKTLESGKSIFQDLVNHLINNKSIPRRRISTQGNFYSRDSLDSLRKIRNISNFSEVDKKSRAFFFPPFEPAYYELNNKKYYVIPENFFGYDQ